MLIRFINIILLGLLSVSISCHGQSTTVALPLDSLNSFLKTSDYSKLDTIFIEDGNYKDIRIQIREISKNSLVITPRNKGNVSISGNSGFLIEKSGGIQIEGFVYKNTIGGIFNINSSTNIGIGNSYFLSCGNNPVTSLVRIAKGTSNNEIYNNIFDNNGAIGISIVNNDKYSIEGLCKNNVIRDNIFRNIQRVKELYPNSNGNGMEAIQIGQMTSVQAISQNLGTVIERNRFEHIIGDQVEIISVKSSSNKIADNNFIDCMGGISIRSGNNNLITGNEFLRVGRAIRLYGAGHRVQNNKLYEVKVGIMIPSGDFRTGENLKIKDGYHMAKDCLIEGNIISNPLDKAIITGNSDKKLLPESLKFKNNKVLIDNVDLQDKIVSVLTNDKSTSTFNIDNFVGKSTGEENQSTPQASSIDKKIGPNWKAK